MLPTRSAARQVPRLGLETLWRAAAACCTVLYLRIPCQLAHFCAALQALCCSAGSGMCSRTGTSQLAAAPYLERCVCAGDYLSGPCLAVS